MLVPVCDRLDNLWGQECYGDYMAHVALIDTDRLRNLALVPVFAGDNRSDPIVSARNRFDQGWDRLN